MRRRRGAFEVFSLSAIDLFASAMGAFIIITIILMPDYQKEVRAEGDLAFLEALAGLTQAKLNETVTGSEDTLEALQAAQTRYERLLGQHDRVSSELETVLAKLQARFEEMPPPPESPVEMEEDIASNIVTFRFLGLKTDRTRLLFVVDMNRYLAPHAALARETVRRAVDALAENYSFGILGFQQLDTGPRFHRWPADGSLAAAHRGNKQLADQFLADMSSDYRGSSSLLDALKQGLAGPADAIVLISDGLPNPDFNERLSSKQLIRRITGLNSSAKEIHTVTIGDYFKYKGTIEFMESLARANNGGFLALAD